MANTNGYETSSLNPGWIKKQIDASYKDDYLKRIILFFVINTPCVDLSSSSISMQNYGWKKDIWKKGELRKRLLSVADLKQKQTFFTVKKTDELRETFERAGLSKGFHKSRDTERLAIYKPCRYNDFLAVCYHIRNAFAHGRFAMYKIPDQTDIMFVLKELFSKFALV